MRKVYLILLFSCIVSPIFSTGIRGKITGDDGQLLAFATIYVKEVGTGTAANAEGYYELNLAPGTYTIVYQYIGYGSLTKVAEISDQWIELDVELATQVVVLKDIEVRAGKEDPAYTIMRKAIAKSKFHIQQVDRYTAKVYIKGTGQLKDSPFFLRKALEKEGIDEDRVFISESVSEVEYIRPNTYNEKVISIRSSGEDKNGSPNGYVYGSFYEPEIANSVSPLSPRAFSYYRFVYDGTYRDRGYEISKINVIPRSKGDNVFQGKIEIVEDYWSLYSVDLKTTKLGINFDVKQIYEPIQAHVWLPITHDFSVDGKVLGFEFEAKYLATVSDYQVEVNPDLDVDIEVIDEKVEKELAEKLEEQVKTKEGGELQNMMASGKELTRKQLRKVIREYEKAELEESKEPEVIENRSFKVDSTAHNSDSLYWQTIRPIPLTQLEVKGYSKTDSISRAERLESEGDTLKTNKKRATRLLDPIFGNFYKLADRTHLRLHGISGAFNTVDGFDLNTRVSFTKTIKNENKNWLRTGATARYAFSRERFNGFYDVRYDFGESRNRSSLRAEAGRYIEQFNSDEPIHPIVNSLMSLLLERNFMKIYEQDYVKLSFRQEFADKLNLQANFSHAHRRQLFNNSRYRLIDRSGDGYTPNAPVSDELPDTSFPTHQASVFTGSVDYRPWLKFRVNNGRRYAINNSSPTFSLIYKQGVDDLLDSDVDFSFIEAGYRHTFKIGIRGIVDVSAKVGTFLTDDQLFFMDYKHFLGNQTPFSTTDPVGSFRLLEYYQFSTTNDYFTGSLHYQFRKFLITQMPLVRLSGVRESFFANYLAADTSNNYTELGYGINYIFRVFRVEAVTSFENGEYKDFGVRLGIAVNLDDVF
ncbi:MAG: DUF5686 and carboxypeptidase regulatory-like domain-containing protein [Bacteroidota bacterium]